MLQFVMVFIALGGFIGLFVNTGQKLFLWFRPFFTSASPLIFGILYGIAVTMIMVLFVLSRLPDSRIPRVIFLVDHYALGVAVLLMVFVNFAAFMIWLLRLIHLFPTPIPRQAALAAGILAVALTVILSVYGAAHASVIRTKNYEIELQGENTDKDSMKIALISDLHLGYVMDEKHVRKIVEAVNKTEPDLVCIAGDIFDGDITSVKDPAALQALLREIDAPYGVYACLGNHDAGPGYEGMLQFLEKAQVQVLQDEAVLIGGRIILAGRKDSGPIGGQGERRKAFEDSAKAEKFPRIILDHNPVNIGEYSRSTDLILCGHTHRGQMFPFNLVTRAVLEVDYGYYRRYEDSPQVIVTSGAGTWGPPQRIGTDNEVAAIRLTFPVVEHAGRQ